MPSDSTDSTESTFRLGGKTHGGEGYAPSLHRKGKALLYLLTWPKNLQAMKEWGLKWPSASRCVLSLGLGQVLYGDSVPSASRCVPRLRRGCDSVKNYR